MEAHEAAAGGPRPVGGRLAARTTPACAARGAAPLASAAPASVPLPSTTPALAPPPSAPLAPRRWWASRRRTRHPRLWLPLRPPLQPRPPRPWPAPRRPTPRRLLPRRPPLHRAAVEERGGRRRNRGEWQRRRRREPPAPEPPNRLRCFALGPTWAGQRPPRPRPTPASPPPRLLQKSPSLHLCLFRFQWFLEYIPM
ncbi:hypothetical protein BRADI_3g19044v3 [Brachypodium distachyon]|uniref:Uncharacterized protein n=1 Tax=Brachypodium distachyon TaxID=15368 RepID=A0A2K2CY69_BRADI|nr:hypothetical protein BRADI_3g19044v3 [Brachypodium distachyon]